MGFLVLFLQLVYLILNYQEFSASSNFDSNTYLAHFFRDLQDQPFTLDLFRVTIVYVAESRLTVPQMTIYFQKA